MAGTDIEKHEFVGPFLLITARHFHGVAGVAQLKEVHALDDAAAIYIQTGNDALGEHALPGQREKARSMERAPRVPVSGAFIANEIHRTARVRRGQRFGEMMRRRSG